MECKITVYAPQIFNIIRKLDTFNKINLKKTLNLLRNYENIKKMTNSH